MKDKIKKVIESAPGAKPAYLEATGWFDDTDEAAIALKEFEPKFTSYAKEAKGILGEPNFTHLNAREQIDQWYPEALLMHCWTQGNKTIYLTLVQHDRQTPVAIELGCFTDQEIAYRSSN